MRVLVTGGAGFIGSHLVDALIAQGHAVRVLDSFEAQVHGTARPEYLNPSAEYRRGDCRDREAVRRALEGVEAIFHQAAAVGVGQSMYEIERYVAANTLGTAVLLEAIVAQRAALKKLIVASSMSVYGEGQYRCASCGPVAPPPRGRDQLAARQWEMRCPACGAQARPEPTPESKPLLPTSVYAVSKRDQEELCRCVGHAYGIPTVALRYFNVYGPRQALSNPYTGVCAIFSARLKHGRAPLVFEDGAQTRDFIHVRDIVGANLLALREPRADGRVLNVGAGRPVSIGEIARVLARLYGVAVAPEITGRFRAGDIRHCAADIGALRGLGFAPSVGLEQGLQELVEWGRRTEAVDRVDEATQELVARGLAEG
jgi:dTDP-L-rhamnose 4-epimerase